MNPAAAMRHFVCICLLAMTSTLSAATTSERSAIDDRYKWDLSKMYANTEAWDGHYKQVESMAADFAAKKGTAGKSAQALLAALKLRDQVNIQLEKLGAYASMRRDEDMRQSAAQALFQRAQTLGMKWDEAASWFQPELLKIPEAQLHEWLQQADLKI
jgi:oligoendopeptidase F